MKKDVTDEIHAFLKSELMKSHKQYNKVLLSDLKNYAKHEGINISDCKKRDDIVLKVIAEIPPMKLLEDFEFGVSEYYFRKKFCLSHEEIAVLSYSGVLHFVGQYEYDDKYISLFSSIEYFQEKEEFKKWLKENVSVILPVRIWTKTLKEIDKVLDENLFGSCWHVALKKSYKNKFDGGYYHYLVLFK